MLEHELTNRRLFIWISRNYSIKECFLDKFNFNVHTDLHTVFGVLETRGLLVYPFQQNLNFLNTDWIQFEVLPSCPNLKSVLLPCSHPCNDKMTK